MKNNFSLFVAIVVIVVLVSVFFVGFESLGRKVNVEVTYETDEVDGPAYVPPPHPVVTITQNVVMKDQWIVITGNGNSSTVAYTAETVKGEKMVFSGYAGDISGGEIMIFDPGDYVLLVYSHPRSVPPPNLAVIAPKYVTTFTIK